jgi:M6 family metalloprotease-like protein
VRRLAGLIFIVSLVGGALAPALATAAPPATPSYDLARVREAMRAGAEAVGAPPAEAAAYFADRPLQWFHPTQDAVTQTQPDGSSFEARVLELEDGGGQATTTGRLITRADDGWWYYGVRAANGRIGATEARVGIDPAPAGTRTSDMPAEFKANLTQHQAYAAELNDWFHARFAAQAQAATAAGEPVVFKVPALMLAINNEAFLEGSTPDTVEARYSGIGTSPTGTVTEMYLEQSFGNLVVQVDVYGIYTSALSMNPVNDCWYGTDGGPVLGDTLGLGGYGAKGLAAEAVPQADPEVDFSEYDMDGDGYVDFLMIVHSGRGAETSGDPCDVHSHRFGGLAPALVDGAPSEPTPMTADGVAIGQALTVPEIDAGIGVVAHELMHAFGEPDYYGTAGTSGTGDWDLGGGGSYGGVPTQSSPLHFNPLMKINFGWVEPRRIDATTLDVELRPRASHPDLLLVPVREVGALDPAHQACDNDPINSGQNQVANFIDEDGDCLVEGYLIEFLSPTSAATDHDACTFTPADFDRQMYGTGLAIWHYDLTNYKQLGNNERLRPMLDLEEFDRRDVAQEMEQNLSRAEPIDLFWGDPVGISSATAAGTVSSIDIPAPGGSPYVVTAVPGTAATTDPWVAPSGAPTGAQMTVTLSWPTEDTDDWDLAVFKNVDGEWIEVDSDGAPPGEGPESVTVPFTGGAEYRAEAVNYASVSMTAEVTVEYAYNSEIATKFGPANTLSADFEPTGWSFTNIRPFDYLGFAHAAQAGDASMTLDLVKHDATTVDVSGDFLHVVTGDGFAAPVKAGRPVMLRSAVYNHGGKAVTGATFRVYDHGPGVRRRADRRVRRVTSTASAAMRFRSR